MSAAELMECASDLFELSLAQSDERATQVRYRVICEVEGAVWRAAQETMSPGDFRQWRDRQIATGNRDIVSEMDRVAPWLRASRIFEDLERDQLLAAVVSQARQIDELRAKLDEANARIVAFELGHDEPSPDWGGG